MHANTGLVVVLLGLGAIGCVSLPDQPRGETLRLHTGSVPVVFTNATPAKMCGLYMSYEDQDAYGDNWLPRGGLASGKSIEFRVRQGRYKARWDTCTTGGKPLYAATLWRELGFVVDQETQLYAYVADRSSPTQRAAVLTHDYQIVRFQGQHIGGPDWNQPARDQAKPLHTVIAADRPAPKVNLREFIETRSAKTRRAKPHAKRGKGSRVGAVRPSLKRSHDIVGAKVRYRRR